MSSRAVRKALKRKQEEEAAKKLNKGLEEPEEVEDDDREEETVTKTPYNPFALLNEAQGSEDEETVAPVEKATSVSNEPISSITPAKKSKNKKKKKKPANAEIPTPITPKGTQFIPAPSDLDDIDRAIQEISQKYGDTPIPSPSSTPHPSLARKYSLLAISLKNLDADFELRKLFGKIVDAEAREASRQNVHGVSPRVLNRIKATQVQRKRTLMKPKDEWQLFAAYNKRMLSMDILEKENGVTKFKFVHSRRYQDVQMQFFITALGGDGNVLMGLLREHPFHVDTCVQVSEILKHQGSLSEAADLIERAMFSLDCGLHPMFNLTLGTTRLPFEYFENRSFYLAVWHHMESLGRRGCWRTCLEFNKLLFAVEPEQNPYAALLAIDYPAMKAREYAYLIDLRDSQEWVDETGYLLNIHYSAALAEYMLEKDQKQSHEESSEALSRAIQRFPWLIAQLFYTLKLDFPTEFPTTVPPSPLQALYTDLYIHRSKDLWTISEISSWLSKVTKQIAPQVVEHPPSQTEESVPLNVARHLFVLNVPPLLSHIPREFTSRTQLASDPLPPDNSISPYDTTMRSMSGMARDEGALNRWLRGLVRGEQNAEAQGEVFLDDDGEAEEDDDSEDEEEHDETLVAQLTNTFRNVFGWFGSRESNEHEDDGHDVD